MPQLSAAESQHLEREYVAHRGAVLAMLRVDFHGLNDPEELYQEAWAELLELRARGKRIDHTRALLKKIAWRRARDEHRDRHTNATDPTSHVLVDRPDAAVPVDEQAQARLDSIPLRHIIDDLEPRHAAVIKLRFDEHRSASEIQERLGITAKRMEKIVAVAYDMVQAQLDAPAGGESRWRRRQRSLLLACETGLASGRQRARAQRMVAEDPICRAMLHEMRDTLRDLGALVPLPLVLDADDERFARLRGGMWDRFAIVREHLHDLFARSAGHAQSLEQAGAATTATAGAGVAAKVALVCVFTAGGTFACVQSGLLGRGPPARQPAQAAPTRTVPPRDPPPPPVAHVVRTPKSVHRATTHSVSSSRGSRSASAPAAASPAAAGSTEFGPGAIGSTSSSTQPAAAPSGGGGEFLP